MSQLFSERLLAWYDQHGRKNLPWQHNIKPYRVWVSEIMLQQTQVDTVIPYFERFMQRFATVEALASAPIDEVLHLWTGLGYYARARNLHACAQMVVEQHKGEFPTDPSLLEALPGIGRSTAAAITSIAFEQPTAILDGNVKRVLARHQAVAGWPGKPDVAKQLWKVAEANMPQQRCRDYTQAIMDLGATLCTRSKPQCPVCPVQQDCRAYAQGQATAFPESKPKKLKPVKSAYLLIVESPEGEVLLEQRPPQGIWGGLWCLPELPLEQEALETHLAQHYPQPNAHSIAQQQPSQTWPSLRHTFSHYHFDIVPVHLKLSQKPKAIQEAGKIWYKLAQPQNLGLAAPVKKLLQQLQQQNTAPNNPEPGTQQRLSL